MIGYVLMEPCCEFPYVETQYVARVARPGETPTGYQLAHLSEPDSDYRGLALADDTGAVWDGPSFRPGHRPRPLGGLPVRLGQRPRPCTHDRCALPVGTLGLLDARWRFVLHAHAWAEVEWDGPSRPSDGWLLVQAARLRALRLRLPADRWPEAEAARLAALLAERYGVPVATERVIRPAEVRVVVGPGGLRLEPEPDALC